MFLRAGVSDTFEKIWDSIPYLRHLSPDARIYIAAKLVEGTGVELTPCKHYGPIVITHVRQDCFACPSSWTAWDENGKEYVLRYRNGVGLLKSYEDDRGEMIAKFNYGDDYAGICTLDEFVERIGGYLALSEDLQHVDRAPL